jgi:hypothetical protein
MADNNFRPYRDRGSAAGDDAAQVERQGSSDPLAELARLIGQADPYVERSGRETHSPGQSQGEAEGSGLDWAADDGYDEQRDRAEGRYGSAATPPQSVASHPSYEPQERGYERGGRYFSGLAGKFNGFREDGDRDYRDEQQPDLRPRELPTYATAASGEGQAADEPEHDGSEPYGADDYYDNTPAPGRRRGLVLVLAVLGLAVVGTAGAFAYRTMFGGSLLPALPPIIKASNGPNKIIPSSSDAQASNSNQAGEASTGSSENLVSREEQPVNMEPAKVAPRVVATIPVTSGQSQTSSGAAAPAPPSAVAPAPATITGSSAGPSPGGTAPAPMAAQTAPAPAASPVPTQPKRVHTVTIHADQAGDSDAVPTPPVPPPAPVQRSAARPAAPTAKPSAPPAGSNSPMSIIPGAEGDVAAAAPSHVRTAAAPMSTASATPVAASEPSSGRYVVQVSSQHSEADAQASFQALQAKYPNQLSGREPIIRRADLGAKGVYYRALVGPFASMEDAAAMCSGLKAAGGNCLVQRN